MPNADDSFQRQETWRREYMLTRNRGAEFVLPWAVDVFFRAMQSLQTAFSAPELKTILEAHKAAAPAPAGTLLERVRAACGQDRLSEKHGIAQAVLESKLQRLDSTQETVLTAWACAFWSGTEKNGAASVEQAQADADMDAYVRRLCS